MTDGPILDPQSAFRLNMEQQKNAARVSTGDQDGGVGLLPGALRVLPRRHSTGKRPPLRSSRPGCSWRRTDIAQLPGTVPSMPFTQDGRQGYPRDRTNTAAAEEGRKG